MRALDRAPSWAFAVAMTVGVGLAGFAIVAGSTGAVLIGLMGLVLAGKSAIVLARRSGAADQPQ